jgi:signal transduction histidine kinase
MFKLVRYFSITSLVALGAASIASGLFYKQLATEKVLKFGEHENIIVTQSFANSLWAEFKPFLLSTAKLSDEELKNHPETQRLQKVLIAQTQGLTVAKVKIFDLRGRTVFSTDFTNIGQDYSSRPGFIAAQKGLVTTKLDHKDTFKSFNGTVTDRQLISSYVPLRQKTEQGEQIDGVFELYNDVTPLVKEIQNTQNLFFLMSAGLWSVIYIILLLIVSHAAKIMRHQYQIQQQTETALRDSEQQARHQADDLDRTLKELKASQTHLIQAEKMSSLGQLVAGVAHEINNPVNFIHANIPYVEQYAQDLIEVVQLYQTHYFTPATEIATKEAAIDLKFLQEDLPKILNSMKMGTDRIAKIVLSLRNFSRLDEADFKAVDLHEGIDSTLSILQYRLNASSEYQAIQVIKNYSDLPLVECYPGKINQVLMNILVNAIDALQEHHPQPTVRNIKTKPSQITIQTNVIDANSVKIVITDNGVGLPDDIKQHIFDPFFTTKPVGQGTGLGMYISHQIITDQHCGQLECYSNADEGTQFMIQIPIQQQTQPATLQS